MKANNNRLRQTHNTISIVSDRYRQLFPITITKWKGIGNTFGYSAGDISCTIVSNNFIGTFVQDVLCIPTGKDYTFMGQSSKTVH